MKFTEAEFNESAESRELAEASLMFKNNIEKSLLKMNLDGISHVDIVFYDSSEGVSPSVSVRRVKHESNQKTMDLYKNVYRIVRFDAVKLREIRREINE